MSNSSVAQLSAAFEVHYEELIAHVRRRVNCSATAQDIVQETYLRASKVDDNVVVHNPRAFLYRIASNLAIDHLRRERTRGRHLAPDQPDERISDDRPDAERAVGDRERLALLLAIVDELPPKCREVFVLRKFDGLDQGEIAIRLGIGRNMVNKHIRNALLHCTTRLRELERDK